jgi:signal peptidase I
MLSKLIKIITALIIIFCLGIGLLLILSSPWFSGNIRAYVVTSGSMEPAIGTGSLIFVKAQKEYFQNDIITFSASSLSTPITHRIHAVAEEGTQKLYETKGDANEEADPVKVSQTNIIGKKFLSLPALGYILDFAKQPVGFITLIALPAGIIIVSEAGKIIEEAKNIRRRKLEQNNINKGEHIEK